MNINDLTDADLETAARKSQGVESKTSQGMASSGVLGSLEAPLDSDVPLEELNRLGIRELWGKTNFKAPAYSNQKEKYEHRVIAHLKACCKTNVEIARLTGFSPVTINYLVRQPFMETMILQEIRQQADPALALLSNAAFDSAKRLIQLAETAENEECRRKANNDILDRKYGKPNQPMTMREVSAKDVSDAELIKLIEGQSSGSVN